MSASRMFRVIVVGGVALVAGPACGSEQTGETTDTGAGNASDAADSSSGGDPCGPWVSCECPDGHFACEYACLMCRRSDTGTADDSAPPITDATDETVVTDASSTESASDGEVGD